MNAVLQFENVSKRFITRLRGPVSFQETIINRLRGIHTQHTEEFWALDDFCCQIDPGEMVGIIGQNGAGKSTILKLISRVIEPTSGTIRVKGRVGALLELGTGFHPDLTGRENIYLSGAIQGMNRTQIQQRLDDIIGFAEIERFIDVAVKNYSSGMAVRLGFSVAVYTDPEILLVDEVLAVGDAGFQRKCIERIDQLRCQGVTILFVSHDMDDIRNLCNRAIWLHKGKIVDDSVPENVVRQFLSHSFEDDVSAAGACLPQHHGSGEVRIEKVWLGDQQGKRRSYFVTSEPLVIKMRYRAQQRIEQPVFSLDIRRSDGTYVTGLSTQSAEYDVPPIEGDGVIQYTVPRLPLLEGTYHLSVTARDRDETRIFDHHDRSYVFRVLNPKGDGHGLITLHGEWSQGGDFSTD